MVKSDARVTNRCEVQIDFGNSLTLDFLLFQDNKKNPDISKNEKAPKLLPGFIINNYTLVGFT